MLTYQVYRRFYYILTFICLSFFINTHALAKAVHLQQIDPGTLSYARLETAITVENQDAPITATITSGKFKGAKLQGKLTFDSGKPTLHFTSIRLGRKWPHPKPINAYAIDFDVVRTALLTRDEPEDLERDGVKMAASFLRVYTEAEKIKMGMGNDLGILFMSPTKS